MPRTKSTIAADDLRSTLLDRAADLLAHEGPQALTTRRIAAAADTSTQAIYTLFGGKEGVVRAMYREGFRRLGAKLAQAPRTSDPVADITELGRAYRAAALENPNFYDVMFGRPVPEFRCTDDDRAESLATFTVLVDAVQRALDQGRLQGGTAKEIATHLWATVHGYVTLELAGYRASGDRDPDAHYESALAYAIAPFLTTPPGA
ncbi:MAG TPA: TetR/AcrR family transcriptional regulator [Actinopolymorphaceae bacterium]|jgi:AcrR family transcriptional regulator